MYRNLQSHFATLPDVNIKRTRMDIDSSTKTSFNVGQVIPFYLFECVPGDSVQIRTNLIARMQPLVSDPLDDLVLDTYYFFCPLRLVWEHTKQFFGENTESAWYPTAEYSIPQIVSGKDGFEIGSIADYLGLPVNVGGLSVSALPFRAYSLIMNEFFRDENLVDPLETPMGDAQQTYYPLGSAYNPAQYANGGEPFIAAKFHDYFSSALPGPQKGPSIEISLADFSLNSDGIVYTGLPHDNKGSTKTLSYTAYNLNGNDWTNGVGWSPVIRSWNNSNPELPNAGSQAGVVINGEIAGIATGSTGTGFAGSGDGYIYPNNLYASMESTVSGVPVITINQLRQAIALQQLYEIDARSGSRYTEIIKGHFGVTSPDARLQRPEYLGGNRVPINVNQVVQTSASDNVTPQGNVAGMSITTDQHGDFMHSFTEHGYIIGVCVVRYAHTYQQGIERHWSRKNRFDFFWPGLVNVGEQAILNKEIFAQGTDADDEVFGYQEQYADMRYKPSRVTGELRSNHNNTLDSWHFADDYAALPYLSADWIREDKNNVDRALAVTSAVSNQIFADFYIENVATRPMPMFSIPGLERI